MRLGQREDTGHHYGFPGLSQRQQPLPLLLLLLPLTVSLLPQTVFLLPRQLFRRGDGVVLGMLEVVVVGVD